MVLEVFVSPCRVVCDVVMVAGLLLAVWEGWLAGEPLEGDG